MARPRTRPTRRVQPAPCLALGLSALALLACSPIVATHGHRLDEQALAQIEPGRSSRDEVAQLLGSPSSRATFGDSTWYYVSQRTEQLSFYQADVTDQDVVVIGFDDQGVVSSIERHGLDAAREIELVSRETPTSGTELGVLEQFVGNIGRFNPPPEDADILTRRGPSPDR
jgi:outer membrane protein assembly factor BamE (lipoprotein component of BamABCDE complex)